MGRNRRDVLTPWEAALLVGATYRLWRLASDDQILDGPREKLLAATPVWVEDLVECPWCLGFWMSAAAYVSWRAAPQATLAVATPFALSAAVGATSHALDS